ncbi:sensor histidine kinase [Nonomuraea sp. NPDC050310]|uniref:sensor histidine kinase n=1 Tax=Nonomuraea sp. NPDC050310 TaxID=3154935 RepID=UPI0033E98A7E
MPPTRDWLLALAMVPVQLAGVLIVSVPIYVYDTGGNPPVRLVNSPLDWLGHTLLVASALALLVRSRRPRLALGLTVGLFTAYMLGGYTVGPVVLPVMICLLTAALTGRHRAAVAIGLAVSVLAAGRWVPRIVELYGDAGAAAGTVIAFFGVVTAIFGGPVLLGEMVSSRREAAEAKIAEARREAEQRVVEERLRIARDLHDVVAHSMAGIAVQAAATLRVLGEPAPQVAASLTAIRTAAKEALAELRATVGDLRGGVTRAGEGAEGLDTLLAAVRDAGMSVQARVEGLPRPLADEAGVAVYRCVQESLTNVLRHAGAGASAEVVLAYGEAELVIEVTDDGAGPPPPVPATPTGGPGATGGAGGGGYGLAGMRERFAALGGSVVTGAGPEGGFRVHARLPFRTVARP